MSTAIAAEYNWVPQPQAQQLVDGLLTEFLCRCPRAATLAARLRLEAGVRIQDLVDYISTKDTPELRRSLRDAGFVNRPQPGAAECFVHDGGIFPCIIPAEGETVRVGLKVECVADFFAANGVSDRQIIDGEPLSRFRTGLAFACDNAELWTIERHGYRGFVPVEDDPAIDLLALRHFDKLRRRERDFTDDALAFARLNELLDHAISDLGVDWTCDLFFKSERDYWQRRNRAGRFQKARQDVLGIGWANHDHHTYRCTRRNFTKVIGVFEKIGCRCRERFYAGEEAGWGAQVLEQPAAGIVIFADVDLSPSEVEGDFAHDGLSVRDFLGTVGLWTHLHGESMLQAGMHHLEAQFDWHALRDQLEAEGGIKTMDPFTTLPFLRQAFTEGERWPVKPERVDDLVKRGLITLVQGEMFKRGGAIGSHLENLERNDGFKGFNQHGVSEIIARTNPVKQVETLGA